MGDRGLTRRSAAAGLAAAGLAPPAFAAAAPRAREVAARVRAAFGPGWKDGPTDGLVLGDPALRVTGIAVTAMPSMAMLREAQKRGLNLIVSHEAPLFSRPFAPDAPATSGPFGPPRHALANDPIHAAKKAYVEENGLAVLQLAANLRARAPDPMVAGAAAAMGWSAYADPADPRIYAPPPAPLRAVVGAAGAAFGAKAGLRYIGDPEMSVRRVLLVPGTTEAVSTVKAMPHVDLLLTGDLREWELVEYIFDSWQSGPPKALIAVGRVLSEQPGMAWTADWLRGQLRGVRVEHLKAEDPYWRPA